MQASGRYFGRAVLAAVAFTWALALPARAGAADVSEAVYQDVKAAIQDLMEEEVAHTAVPKAVCEAPILLTYYPASMQRLYDRQLGALKGGLRQETATLFGSYVYHSLRHGPLEFREFLRAEWPALRTQAGLLSKTDCPGDVSEANGPYYFARLQANTEELRPLLDRECPDTAKNLVACELGLAAREYLLSNPAAGEDHLRRILAFLIGVQHNLRSQVQLEELNVIIAAYVNDPLLAVIPVVDDDRLRAALKPGSALLSSVRALAREWALLTRSGKRQLAFESLTQTFLSPAFGQLTKACEESPLCTKLRLVAKDDNLRDLLDAVSRSDVRAVAVEALRAAFASKTKAINCAAPEESNLPDSDACTRQIAIGRYGRFAATLASYVLEYDDNQQGEATRAAFRSAAFDLLRTDGPRSGFDRGFGLSIVLPHPALRLSWSPGYINESTANGFRYVATLDWLTFRLRMRYNQSLYVASYVALVDLLGPLSESALRQQSPSPDQSGRIWNNFLAPHAELIIGFPGLSTHLGLVAGVSYRATAAFRDATDSSKYAYYTWLSSDRPPDYDSKPKAFYSQFIESSIGIKYVP